MIYVKFALPYFILLFLSIPVTVTTAERSFRKLKIIKSYLRNSINQNRLCNLAFLAIEHHAAENLNLKTLITHFTNKKSRRTDI